MCAGQLARRVPVCVCGAAVLPRSSLPGSGMSVGQLQPELFSACRVRLRSILTCMCSPVCLAGHCETQWSARRTVCAQGATGKAAIEQAITVMTAQIPQCGSCRCLDLPSPAAAGGVDSRRVCIVHGDGAVAARNSRQPPERPRRGGGPCHDRMHQRRVEYLRTCAAVSGIAFQPWLPCDAGRRACRPLHTQAAAHGSRAGQQGPMAGRLPGHTAALPAAMRVPVCHQLETWVKRRYSVIARHHCLGITKL